MSVTFLGATVRGCNTSIGWNVGSPSQLSVQIVDDPINGLIFTPPDLGTPVHFEVGSFRFSGLFQRWGETRAIEGNPAYEVSIVDPREILDGAQLIIGSYGGSVGGVRNLYNIFGYWETAGFGGSLVNEGGMPWFRIRDGVLALANTTVVGAYGAALSFRGYNYSVDLSEVPVPPVHYRLGGTSISLMEAIAQVCEDGGCDFFVDLVGFTIRIRTVSRHTQPPLGVLSSVASANYGSTSIRIKKGLELRNEITAAFLVGGEVTDLWQTDAIQQFWGYDVLGLPILGEAVEYELNDKLGVLIDALSSVSLPKRSIKFPGLDWSISSTVASWDKNSDALSDASTSSSGSRG